VSAAAEARPASTVVLLREGAAGPETLLLKRNKALAFAGGLWVFPGGALDPADLEAAGGDLERASTLAAAREAGEECGQSPLPEDMALLSHWTTPLAEKRRFATWFYIAAVRDDNEAVVDGSEILDARWIGPGDALAAHRRGELGMLPPTYVTLAALSRGASVADLLRRVRRREAPRILPVLTREDDTVCVLLPGDAGFVSGDPTRPGPRHRARLRERHWQYQYQGVAPSTPSLLELD
jgi:8-oxo-dGTP pyrophosphatase MutT (NUDIX family)